MISLENKIVTVIGAQKSGLSAAKLALEYGARVKITDGAYELAEDTLLWVQGMGIELELNRHTQEFVVQSDIVVLSPGVSINSEVVAWARDADVIVMGEIEFAYQFCTKPIVAVTGSNGKTTVSMLISQMINQADYRAVVCGNIGTPFSDIIQVSDELDYIVLEVSSFQMESLVSRDDQEKYQLKGFKPLVGVLLNLNQNHLDRHRDMDEYFEAKAKIFANQSADDFSVLNYDLNEKTQFINALKGQVCFFNKSSGEDINPNEEVLTVVAKTLNIDPAIAERTFKSFKGVEHRLENVGEVDGVHFINDSKSTTIESGRWAIKNVEGPIVLLCGGKDKNLDFALIADDICKYVKTIIVYGEAREKIEQAFLSHQECLSAVTMEDAFKMACERAEKKEVILLSPMCASFDAYLNFEERGAAFKDLVKQWAVAKEGSCNA